jgi:uncharacterized membrane protein YhaH (DUF805 family)
MASTTYFKWLYFSMRGRTSRRSYWVLFSLPLFLLGILFGLFTAILSISPRAIVISIFLVSPVLIWAAIAVSVKRLHDFGRSGWWALLCAVPYLDLVTTLVLGLIPGDVGVNKYGDGPNKGTVKAL